MLLSHRLLRNPVQNPQTNPLLPDHQRFHSINNHQLELPRANAAHCQNHLRVLHRIQQQQISPHHQLLPRKVTTAGNSLYRVITVNRFRINANYLGQRHEFIRRARKAKVPVRIQLYLRQLRQQTTIKVRLGQDNPWCGSLPIQLQLYLFGHSSFQQSIPHPPDHHHGHQKQLQLAEPIVFLHQLARIHQLHSASTRKGRGFYH